MPNSTSLIAKWITLNKFSIYFVVLFGLLTFCIFIFNVNGVIASDPNSLKEIDVVNGGFRDLKWGRHISDCEDMVYKTHKQTSGGNVKIYNRNKDSLVLDNRVKLSKIEYGFLNSKLLFVVFKTSGPDNSKALQEVVLSRFGDDNKNEQTEHFYWTINNTNVILQNDSSSNHAVLMLVSKEGLSSNFNK